jgi:hypothetical protein
MLFPTLKHYIVGALIAYVILVGSGVFSRDACAQERALRVVEVMDFQWSTGNPKWKENSLKRLPNALFKVGNGRFSFDLPDMARGLYPIQGTLQKQSGNEVYFVGTSEDSPGPGYGQITHIEGTLKPEGEAFVASFIHSTRTYSTGFQSSYSAKVRLK